MWSAWLSLKTYHLKPSSELEITDSIAAHCLDKCVLWFGIMIENLLGERVEVGDGNAKRWEAKYELQDLLDPDFRVPREMPKPKKARGVQGMDGIQMLMAMASNKNSGVKLWRPIKAS